MLGGNFQFENSFWIKTSYEDGETFDYGSVDQGFQGYEFDGGLFIYDSYDNVYDYSQLCNVYEEDYTDIEGYGDSYSLLPMLEIPLMSFDTYKSQSDENIFDLDFEPIERKIEISDESYFVFDEQTGSIALKQPFGYYGDFIDGCKTEIKIVIPSEMNGKPVTKIGINSTRVRSLRLELRYRLFALGFTSAGITEVVIPETVTEIDEHAFAYCYQLKKINFPKSLKKIGRRAFAVCMNLKDYELPDNVEVRRRCI